VQDADTVCAVVCACAVLFVHMLVLLSVYLCVIRWELGKHRK